ncbi:hypothetical protein GGR57DRAFT_485281 [Xylariaceae sp. FL1272]|nr:hypothetical protein GGR57DRAFT_485281 [Xylariaceae sp. FL1272]
MADDKTNETVAKATDTDVKFFTTFFSFVPQNIPGFDWEGFAQAMGMKSAKIAKTRYGQIRKKLGITSAVAEKGDSVHTTTAGPSTPSKVTKAKTPRKTPANAAAQRRNLISSLDDGSAGDATLAAYDDDDEEWCLVIGRMIMPAEGYNEWLRP